MTDHTTHDLAIARAERDAWQSTCEELHRAIAGRDVEIESHLGRCEAADQRARSLDAALTAEREAGKGLVAQAEAVRADSRHHAAIAAQNATLASERDAAIAERDACAYDLRAIRDLVAPGNPQGTVVDAVRARLDAVENAQAFGIRERDAAIARAEKAESDLAELTVTRDRLLAREHEDGRLHAQLRVELAELRARPVLTEDLLRGALDAHGHAALTRKLFAHLGPFTLPSPDRAEELTAAIYGAVERAERAMTPGPWEAKIYTTHVAGTSQETQWHEAIAGGPSSGTVVCETEWSVFEDESAIGAANIRGIVALRNAAPALIAEVRALRAAAEEREAERMAKATPAREVAPTRVLVHADGGACHGSRVVDGRCVGCGIAPDMQSTSMWLDADARPVQCEPAKVVAPTLVAVSDEELAVAFYSEPERPALRECIDAADLAGIRAVRDKLGAAEVTEERVKAALCEHFKYEGHRDWSADARAILAYLRATAAKGG